MVGFRGGNQSTMKQRQTTSSSSSSSSSSNMYSTGVVGTPKSRSPHRVKKAGSGLLSPSSTNASSSSTSSESTLKMKSSGKAIGGSNSNSNNVVGANQGTPSSQSSAASTSTMGGGGVSGSNGNGSAGLGNTASLWRQRQQIRRLRVVLISTLFMVLLFFFPPPYQHGLFRELQYDDDDKLPPYFLPESVCINDVAQLPPLWQASSIPISYFSSATEDDFDQATFDEYTSSTDEWDQDEQALMERSMQTGLDELVNIYLKKSITDKRIRNLKTMSVQSLLDQVYHHHRYVEAVSNKSGALWSSRANTDDPEAAFSSVALDASIQVLKIATQKYLASTAAEFDGTTCSRVAPKLQFLAYTEYLYRLVHDEIMMNSADEQRREQKSELYYSENDKKNELEELKLVMTNRLRKTFAACEKKSRSGSSRLHRHGSNKKQHLQKNDVHSLALLHDMYGFDHETILQASSTTRESEIAEWMTGVMAIVDASSLLFPNSQTIGDYDENTNSEASRDDGSDRDPKSSTDASWPYPKKHNHLLVTVFHNYLFHTHQWSNARSRPHKGFKWLKLRETAYLATSVGLQFLTGNGRRGQLVIDDAPWLYRYIRENFYWALAYGNLELLSNFLGVLRLYGCTPESDVQVRHGMRLLLHWYEEAGDSWMRHKEHYQVDGYTLDDIDYIRKAWSALVAVKPGLSEASFGTDESGEEVEGEKLDGLYERELRFFLEEGAELAAELEATADISNKGRVRRNRIRKIQM